MARLFNLVRVYSTTTGTSNVVLGTAVSGFNGPALSGVTSGLTVAYGIQDSSQSEVGTAVWNSSVGTNGILTSRAPSESTLGGGAITLSGSSNQQVIITARAEDIANPNESNTFSAVNNFSANNVFFTQQTFYSSATSFTAAFCQAISTDTSLGPYIQLDRSRSSVGASNDFLGAFQFSGRDVAGNFIGYGTIAAQIIDASSSSPDGAFALATASSGSVTTRFTVAQGLYSASVADKGADTINCLGYYLNGSSLPVLAYGTYTPTLSFVTNVASATNAGQAQYLRVGTTVTVSGRLAVDPTSGSSTASELGVSLPIASAMTAAQQCAGSASPDAINGQTMAIRADAVNDRASIIWNSQTTAAHNISYQFTYTIV